MPVLTGSRSQCDFGGLKTKGERKAEGQRKGGRKERPQKTGCSTHINIIKAPAQWLAIERYIGKDTHFVPRPSTLLESNANEATSLSRRKRNVHRQHEDLELAGNCIIEPTKTKHDLIYKIAKLR